MYRTGHLGISMLVFAPIGYLLLVAGAPLAALVTGGVMLWLAMLPDVDHRLPLISHRGVTHSLLFAIVIGSAFGGVGFGLVQVGGDAIALELLGVDSFGNLGIVTFGFAVGFLAVGSHLLGDILTPAGVNLFWPIQTPFSLNLTSADDTLANYGLFVLGVASVAISTTLGLGLA
jgi:inner membrane protein